MFFITSVSCFVFFVGFLKIIAPGWGFSTMFLPQRSGFRNFFAGRGGWGTCPFKKTSLEFARGMVRLGTDWYISLSRRGSIVQMIQNQVQNFSVVLNVLKYLKLITKYPEIKMLTLTGWAFSVACQTPGWGPQRPGCKNQGWHQLIETKLCMSNNDSCKIMSDVKFESGSFSIFQDMTSENFRLKREQVIRFGYLPPVSGFNFKK